MKDQNLTKEIILDFLSNHKMMVVATYDKEPWIATVYYSFDKDLNLYFLSSEETKHVKQVVNNPKVTVAITNTNQKVTDKKKGLQISGTASQMSDSSKIKHALRHWKEFLSINNPDLSYENMIKKIIKGRIFMIKPSKIKMFNEELFDTEDGDEPIYLV